MLNLELRTEDAQLSYTKVMNTSRSKKRTQHIGFAAIIVKLGVQV